MREGWRKFILPILLVLPLIGLGIAFGRYVLGSPDRYEARYFTADYLVKFDTPGGTALFLEQALQDGDAQLMRELLATKAEPAPIQARPDLLLYDLRNRSGDYYNYLYTTENRRYRRIEHITFVDGRYLVAEEDLYYTFESGRWPQVFGPLAVTYYVLLLLALGVLRLSRRPAKAAQA